MEILTCDLIKPKFGKEKIDGNKYAYAFSMKGGFGFNLLSELFNGIYINDKYKKIVSGIRNVTGTKAEFQEIVDSEPYDLTDGSRKPLDDWYKSGKTRIWDWYTNEPEDFLIPIPGKYKGKIPYQFESEVARADSFKDITIVYDNFSDKEEYYKTSEILEVLEKWKEALEKWNDPVEKKRMIEEYERENKNK